MSSATLRAIEGLLAPLRAELSDPTVSEILVNGPSVVYVERAGRLERTEAAFDGAEALVSALRAIAQSLGRPLSEAHPVLEGRLLDGSRIEAILAPVAAGGPCLAIRRHHQAELDLQRLMELGAIRAVEVAYLREALGQRQNVLVSGGTGSGKTSLLNCLASLVPAAERIVTIEDARELRLQQPHVVSLEARPADERGRGKLGIGDLFRATLRLRPDRIVIGELRGPEAFDFVQAMTSGHGGSMSTLHASSPHDALGRLESMALERQLGVPLSALRRQIASAIDVVVQVERSSTGQRKVVEIAEVDGLDPNENYSLRSRFGRST